MRITQVYTRTGDSGTTHLVGGQEVPKDHRRVSAYGSLDELNAILGLARAFLRPALPESAAARLEAVLQRIQNDLFRIGGFLATLPDDRWDSMPRIAPEDVAWLENRLDAFNGELAPLEEFLLPGGGPVSAFLHQARTVARRAERVIVSLWSEAEETDPSPLRYVNRLSDLLFVLARWSSMSAGEKEVMWERR
jgi:cob(I)alamin adenosyltransferase